MADVTGAYLAAKAAWQKDPGDPDVVARFNAAEAALRDARATATTPGSPSDGDAVITPTPVAGVAGGGTL